MSLVLFGLPRGQLEAFTKAIDTAMADIESVGNSGQKRDLLGKDLARFVQNSLEIPRLLRDYANSTLDLIPAHLIENYEQTGDDLREAFAKGITILEGIELLVHRFQNFGGTVVNSQTLTAALAETRLLESEIMAHWPTFSEEDVKSALGEFERGQCVEVDDAFAQIAGMDREAWLSKVAERKRDK